MTEPSAETGHPGRPAGAVPVGAPAVIPAGTPAAAAPDPDGQLGPAEPATADERADDRSGQGPRHRSFLRELPVLVVVALVLALLIKTFLVQAFYIPSGSMENTLQVRDRVLVNKLVYDFRPPHRGEIIVFNGVDSWTPEVTTSASSNPVLRFLHSVGEAFGLAPSGEQDFIKRVVGVPGDHVRCCDGQGRVTVNGVALHEPYVFQDDHRRFDATVPKGRLWVMGDHREFSADSRSHVFDPGGGTIPENKVVGRAFLVVWPLSHLSVLSVPATFQQRFGSPAAALAPIGFAAGLPIAALVGGRRRRRRTRDAAPRR